MKRDNSYHVEPVNESENLQQFEGWEVRKIHTGNRPGLILQNPDTGERRKLIISKSCFNGESLKVSRNANFCAQLNIIKKA